MGQRLNGLVLVGQRLNRLVLVGQKLNGLVLVGQNCVREVKGPLLDWAA